MIVSRYPALTETVRVDAGSPVSFPYIPGLLSFRELPLIDAAIKRLPSPPDLFLVSGQGIAHPRRFGIASHLGVLIDRPTIGCAKSVLIGQGLEPGEGFGSAAELTDRGEVVGALVRTRAHVRPVVVSLGHRVDLASAIRIVLSCCDGMRRLPRPLWEVDRFVSRRATKSGIK